MIGMNYNFDKFFPTIQLIGIGIMFITFIVWVYKRFGDEYARDYLLGE